MKNQSPARPEQAPEPPLNQEPGTAAPAGVEPTDAGPPPDPKAREERGNRGPGEMPGFGQGA